MPLTALDPKIALIVIDLLKSIVSLPVAHPVAEVDVAAARGWTTTSIALPEYSRGWGRAARRTKL